MDSDGVNIRHNPFIVHRDSGASASVDCEKQCGPAVFIKKRMRKSRKQAYGYKFMLAH